jgi:hypothetical protein
MKGGEILNRASPVRRRPSLVLARGWFVAGFVAAMILGLLGPANAHLTPYPNSVDSSTSPAEIRYSSSSKYTSAVSNAIGDWNNLPGGVVIAPDTATTIKDLEIFDQYSSDSWVGYFYWNPGADNIKFNKRVLDMSTWTSCYEAKVALHEFGHALDFNHNSIA